MSSYRCYLIDAANHVTAERFLECGTDNEHQIRQC